MGGKLEGSWHSYMKFSIAGHGLAHCATMLFYCCFKEPMSKYSHGLYTRCLLYQYPNFEGTRVSPSHAVNTKQAMPGGLGSPSWSVTATGAESIAL